MIIYLVWYIVILGIGIAYMPFAILLFEGWEDRGWIFSKSLGILTGAYVTWTLNCLHKMRFRTLPCFIAAMVPAAVFWAFYLLRKRRHPRAVRRIFPWKRILIEEAAFFLMMGLWVYIIGFKPEAYGTEKFMDYGFITSMLRSDYMPFADPWYAGSTVNYYYGGQYIAAWLIRLSQVRAGEGYNLMRALVAAMSFFLPFSLVSQMMTDRLQGLMKKNNEAGDPLKKNRETGENGKAANAGSLPGIFAGIAAGCAVAFCGNFHYVVYGIIVPIGLKISGSTEYYRYWFPDSTRYIGYNPDTSDKTIHEFPSYSTVLGDLHAHYINILFVVLVTAIVYAWARRRIIENEKLAFRESLLTRGSENESALPDGLKEQENIAALPDDAKAPGNIAVLPDDAASAENVTALQDDAKMPENAVSLSTRKEAVRAVEKAADGVKGLLAEILRPEILLIGFLTGLFRWTNFWDFPIYYVVCGSILFFTDLRRYRERPGIFWLVLLSQAAVMFAAGKAAALPFTATFDQISSEIGLTHSRSPLYQMIILWWLPVTVSVCFIGGRIAEYIKAAQKRKPHILVAESGETDAGDEEESAGRTSGWSRILQWLRKIVTALLNFFENQTLPDMAAILFAACAMGLVWLPEVIYVKDIYTESHYRANTMFKLTYQAFILFGIVMGYVLIRTLALGESETENAAEKSGGKYGRRGSAQSADRRIFRTAAIAGLCVLSLTGGFIFRSVKDWFGNVLVPENRISTDASVFISESFPNDYGAISWLNTHVTGQPVILEANGDSYSDYGRVSVATGLPTVMGWYVHEWLWRNNTADQNLRAEDIQTIYTSDDEEMVRLLIQKYRIRYIYIGLLEREKFPDLNDYLLQDIGEVAYSDGKTTYILRMP